MDRIKNALTRKFGPLPAWAWLGLIALAIYYYRKHQSSSSTGTGSVATVPPTPQPGQVLEPGESYYDPNTGELSTAPGGGGGDTGSSSGTGIGSNGGGGIGSNGGGGIGVFPPDTTLPGLTPTPTPTTIMGEAKGRPRKAKPKAGATTNKNGDKTVKHTPASNKTRTRGFATIRTKYHLGPARLAGKPAAGTHQHITTAERKTVTAGTHQRPKTPVTRTVVRQRPVASATPQHKADTTPPPRPPKRKVAPRKKKK